MALETLKGIEEIGGFGVLSWMIYEKNSQKNLKNQGK